MGLSIRRYACLSCIRDRTRVLPVALKRASCSVMHQLPKRAVCDCTHFSTKHRSQVLPVAFQSMYHVVHQMPKASAQFGVSVRLVRMFFTIVVIPVCPIVKLYSSLC